MPPAGTTIIREKPNSRWESREVAALRHGVSKHGAGRWQSIILDKEFADILSSRSNIDLKDKWRNLRLPSCTSKRQRLRSTPLRQQKHIFQEPTVEAHHTQPGAARIAERETRHGPPATSGNCSGDIQEVALQGDSDPLSSGGEGGLGGLERKGSTTAVDALPSGSTALGHSPPGQASVSTWFAVDDNSRNAEGGAAVTAAATLPDGLSTRQQPPPQIVQRSVGRVSPRPLQQLQYGARVVPTEVGSGQGPDASLWEVCPTGMNPTLIRQGSSTAIPWNHVPHVSHPPHTQHLLQADHVPHVLSKLPLPTLVPHRQGSEPPQESAALGSLRKEMVLQPTLEHRHVLQLGRATRVLNVEAVMLLLSAGADPTVANGPGGSTAVHSAVMHSSGTRAASVVAFILDLLLHYGAQIDARDATGATALHVTCDFFTAIALLQRGANVNARNSAGETPLFGATTANTTELLALLAHNGASLDCQNNIGETPLIQTAGREGCGAAADLLLRLGAAVNARDRSGRTALHTAASAGNAILVCTLLTYGANYSLVDEIGSSAADLAKLCGNSGCVAVLERAASAIRGQPSRITAPPIAP